MSNAPDHEPRRQGLNISPDQALVAFALLAIPVTIVHVNQDAIRSALAQWSSQRQAEVLRSSLAEAGRHLMSADSAWQLSECTPLQKRTCDRVGKGEDQCLVHGETGRRIGLCAGYDPRGKQGRYTMMIGTDTGHQSIRHWTVAPKKFPGTVQAHVLRLP